MVKLKITTRNFFLEKLLGKKYRSNFNAIPTNVEEISQ